MELGYPNMPWLAPGLKNSLGNEAQGLTKRVKGRYYGVLSQKGGTLRDCGHTDILEVTWKSLSRRYGVYGEAPMNVLEVN